MLETDGAGDLHAAQLRRQRRRGISPAVHSYTIDGASTGVTTDFPPTVVVDDHARGAARRPSRSSCRRAVQRRESPIASVTLDWSLNGVAQTPAGDGAVGGGVPGDDSRAARRRARRLHGHRPRPARTRRPRRAGTSPARRRSRRCGRSRPPASRCSSTTPRAFAAWSPPDGNTFSAGTNDDYVQDATAGINVFRSTDTPTPFAAHRRPARPSTSSGASASTAAGCGSTSPKRSRRPTSPLRHHDCRARRGADAADDDDRAAPRRSRVVRGPLRVDRQACRSPAARCRRRRSRSTPSSPSATAPASLSMKIDKDTDVEGFNPGTTFTLAGIMQQDDFLRPFDTGYNVTPRGRVDLGGVPAGSRAASPSPRRGSTPSSTPTARRAATSFPTCSIRS